MFLSNVPTPSSVCTEGVVTVKEAIAVTWGDKTVIYNLLGVVSWVWSLVVEGITSGWMGIMFKRVGGQAAYKKTHDASTTHTVDW